VVDLICVCVHFQAPAATFSLRSFRDIELGRERRILNHPVKLDECTILGLVQVQHGYLDSVELNDVKELEWQHAYFVDDAPFISELILK